MDTANPLSTAFSRLNRAIETLDSVVEARLEREANLLDAEAEVQRMGADRARLAESLDNVQDRAQKLEHVNREVSRRLVDAMEAIRGVIERKERA